MNKLALMGLLGGIDFAQGENPTSSTADPPKKAEPPAEESRQVRRARERREWKEYKREERKWRGNL